MRNSTLTHGRRVQVTQSIWRALTILGVVLAFTAVLHFTYREFVSTRYSYAGLTYREPNIDAYALAVGATVLAALSMPQRLKRPSDAMLWIIFTLGIAPSILLAQYSQTLPVSEAATMGFVISGCTIGISFLTKVGPRFRLPVRRLERGIDFWALMLTFSAAMYAYLLATTGIRFNLLSLWDVYDVRDDFGTAASGNVIIAYLLNVQKNVINPILMARGIYSRQWMFFVIGAGGQFLMYTTAGHKSDLFTIFAVLGISLLFRYFRRPPGVLILAGMMVASLLAVLVDLVSGKPRWTSLISRRMMIVPGALVAAYVSVFADRPRQNFSEILGRLGLVDNPYESLRPVNIVGAEFVGNVSTAANVNLFGHGYLQYGYFGMVLESLVLVAVLLVANAAARGLPNAVASIVFLPTAMAVVSASIFTTILTHGFWAAVILCAAAPSRGWGAKSAK